MGQWVPRNEPTPDWLAAIEKLPTMQERYDAALEEIYSLRADGSFIYSAFQQAFNLSNQQCKIAVRLAQSLNNAVPYDLVIAAMGPGDDVLDEKAVLAVQLVKLRKKMENSGLPIVTVHGYGLRMDGPKKAPPKPVDTL